MNTNAGHIRRAELKDFPAVARLWVELMAEHESRDERFAIDRNGEGDYNEYLKRVTIEPTTAIFVLEIEEKIVGYILIMVLQNPPTFQLKEYGFVGEMYLQPGYRKQGRGLMLWNRARRWFRRKGVKVVQLNVSHRNPGGQHFWQSVGFQDFLEIKWCDLDSTQEPCP